MALGNSKEAILNLLHIPAHFSDRADHGLHIAYQKYKAHLEACQTYEKMVVDGTWTGKKLTAVDLIELFVFKSFWHSHFKPNFSKVCNYLLMVQWLENEMESPESNLEVWGVEKASYNFKDLHAWLQSAGKGKKKFKVAKDDGGDERKNKKKKDGHKKGKKQV